MNDLPLESIGTLEKLLIFEIFVPTITLYVCALLTLGVYNFRSHFRLLTLTLILAAIMLTIIMFLSFPATTGYEILMFADMVGTLFVYPLAFGFLLEWMYPKWLSGKRIIYCFIAPVLLTILLFLSRILTPTLEPLLKWENIFANLTHPEVWIRIATFLAAITELAIFTHILFKYEKKHRLSIKNNFSFTEGTNLKWVRPVAFQLIAYGVCLFVRDLFQIEGMRFFVGFFLTSTAISACIFSMRQQKLYFRPEGEEKEESLQNEGVIQTQASKNRERLKKQLLVLLEKDEVFRDPNLSIETMYKMLNTNRTYLSNLINQDMGINFYQLINSYRIKKAAKMLQNKANDSLTIKDIATIVGFKSMSTFNVLFKEEYQTLPSSWRKEQITSN